MNSKISQQSVINNVLAYAMQRNLMVLRFSRLHPLVELNTMDLKATVVGGDHASHSTKLGIKPLQIHFIQTIPSYKLPFKPFVGKTLHFP